jgi:hypothetical protein
MALRTRIRLLIALVSLTVAAPGSVTQAQPVIALDTAGIVGVVAWYLMPPTPFAAALARVQNRPTRTATDTLPHCPWRTAAAEPGFRVHAGLRVLSGSADSVEVVLAFRCDNPRGFLHDFYELDETLVLMRRDGVWQIVDARSRVT